VAEFSAGHLRFTDIVPSCRAVLEHHTFDAHPSLESLFELDAWARQEVTRWACI
jgi:1-deoxy-D-xylulose-5-phosphate reductoisomerase